MPVRRAGRRTLFALREYHGLFDRRVWLLAYGQVVQSTGRGLLWPFASLYFYNERHFPLAIVGGVSAIAFPLANLSGMFWGALSDNIGRRPLMIAGAFLACVSPLALALVDTPGQYALVVMLQAVGGAMFVPAARAMVADITPPDRRTRAYGVGYMANNLGQSFGLLVGGSFAAVFGYRALFVWDAIGAGAALVVLYACVAESHAPNHRTDGHVARRAFVHLERATRDLSTPLHDRTFLWIAAASVFASFGWVQLYITYSPYMKNVLGLSDSALAWLLAINTVMVVLLQIPIAHWVERRRRTSVYATATSLLAVSLLITGAASVVGFDSGVIAVMALALAIQTVGEIMVIPAASALMAAVASTSDRFGRYMAAAELTNSLGSGAGATLGGALFDAGRPTLVWPITTAAATAGTLMFLRLRRVLPPGVDDPAAERQG